MAGALLQDDSSNAETSSSEDGSSQYESESELGAATISHLVKTDLFVTG